MSQNKNNAIESLLFKSVRINPIQAVLAVSTGVMLITVVSIVSVVVRSPGNIPGAIGVILQMLIISSILFACILLSKIECELKEGGKDMKNNPNHSANRGRLFGPAKKGITAVVAIVLLLMMTVGAAGLAYVWVSGLQSSIQESASKGVEEVTAAQEAKIGIDSMWNVSGVVTFNLRNTGRYAFPDASRFKIYVDGKPTAGAIGGLSGAFAPKDVKTITLSAADAIFPAPGSPRTFKVSTDIEGVAISYRCSVSSVNQTYC